VKRGLITWDKSEIPPVVFERRIERVRRLLADRQLSAVVVYSELWRSNQARFLSNYMPYFNRALLIIPDRHLPTLLCGLSPRVYSWIRSVTTIEDVRPAGNFAKPLFELAAERGWTTIGILDDPQLPHDIHKSIHSGPLEVLNVEGRALYLAGEDQTELAMRRKTAAMARAILAEELPNAAGGIDHQLVGRLEKRFRGAGAEDLITLVTNGDTVPAPPAGKTLDENYSVSLAVEYRGHWIRLSRPQASAEILSDCRKTFEQSLSRQQPGFCIENLGGSYPYEAGPGSIFALHVEIEANGKRLFYGDTCRHGDSGPQIL